MPAQAPGQQISDETIAGNRHSSSDSCWSASKRGCIAAYAIDEGEIPFGFEFLSKVTLRDINFGKMADDANELMIAGEAKTHRVLSLPRLRHGAAPSRS